ncbi:MAG: protein kinase [Archangiaceae bacterium]|nr:protein kinase [Archangiaceae bacterium]
MGHPDENSLLEFVDGKLTGARAAEVSAHVAGCVECQRVVGADDADDRPTRSRVRAATAEKTQLSDPLIGQRVGAWLIGPRLGAGGMGVVYAATHAQTGQSAAFKLVRSNISQEPSLLRRFQRETELVQQLDHPNIVRVLDVGSFANKEPYCVLELLEGMPLSTHRKKQGRLPATEVIGLLVQLMEALEAAHGAQIVHRDLKPSNLFLRTTPTGTRLTVLDFGLAKNLSQTHETVISSQGLLGTPEYMAPEQIRGLPITPAVDLYAVGVLSWELLVGERPFDGSSPTEVIVRHLEFQPPRPSQFVDVPPALDDLIMSLLEKDPARRPKSAAAVKRQLLTMRPSSATLSDEENVSPRRSTTAIEQPATAELMRSVQTGVPRVAIGVGLILTVAGIAWSLRPRAEREPAVVAPPIVAAVPIVSPPPAAPPAEVEPAVVEPVAPPSVATNKPRPTIARAPTPRPTIASEAVLRSKLQKLRACLPQLPEQNRAMSGAMLDECERLLATRSDATRAEAVGLIEQTERLYFAGACP